MELTRHIDIEAFYVDMLFGWCFVSFQVTRLVGDPKGALSS